MSSQEIHLISKENGESDERLYAVAAWRDSSHFTDDERASLALTEAITRLSDREDPVPDSIWDEATRHYDETALAALILSIATTNLWCLLTACGCCLKAAYACLWQVQFTLLASSQSPVRPATTDRTCSYPVAKRKVGALP